MNEFKDYLEELITSARDEEDQNPDDYIGPDGLMHCGKCRTKHPENIDGQSGNRRSIDGWGKYRNQEVQSRLLGKGECRLAYQ